ncbi:MAG: hypothetical protein KDK27_07825 [Leptospiraceae bacterium]|nr:hypothetical protein [Leptospiraceae bacterium]
MAVDLVLKGRILDSAGFVYVFAMLVGPEERVIREAVGCAGQAAEFSQLDITQGWREIQTWIKTQEFNGKADPPHSGDIVRFLQKTRKNLEQMEHISGLVATRDLETLKYDMALDLEIALGDKNMVIELDLNEFRPEAVVYEQKVQEDLSTRVPVACVIAPFSGVAITRLRLGERLPLRIADPKNARARAYIESYKLKKDRSQMFETEGVLRGLETMKTTKEVLLLFDLPGGTKAYAREDDSTLRVRTMHSERSGKKSSSRSHQALYAGRKSGLFDSPLFITLFILGLLGLAVGMFFALF